MMIATATPPEHAAHLERTSVLAMLVYCVFLAGFFLRFNVYARAECRLLEGNASRSFRTYDRRHDRLSIDHVVICVRRRGCPLWRL